MGKVDKNGYTAVRQEPRTKEGKDPAKQQKAKWRSFRQKVAFILPFVWPVGKPRLQLRVIVAFTLLVAIRGVSVLVPIYSKKIVNALSPPQEPRHERPAVTLDVLNTSEITLTTVPPVTTSIPFPWQDILIFISLRSLRGGAGFLNCLRSLIFVRVTQHAQKSLRLRLFAHLHGLSIRWHLHRKTGEVIKVMDRGVNSVSQILGHVQAQLVPVIIDIVIAIIYFTIASDVWIGLILLFTMASYLVLTIAMSEWRKKFRRKMNDADNSRNASGVDSILNFETVKYFSAESWETDRYAESIDKFQDKEFLVNATANWLGTVQNLVMSLGMLGGCLLSAWYVHQGHFRVGDYVLFLTYLHQLYEPLDLFGAYYRILQQAFVDMENMFDMLAEEQEVQDDPGAGTLKLLHGQIDFNKVCFSYTLSKPLLKSISFTVPPGETYALVGHSGSGKTTITRLLMRFYDIQSGSIMIDHQDIAKVSQASLRHHLGVVPQDTGLFNSEVRYNIRYGRTTATDTEVEEAARVADIHNRIVNLPGGYDSKIGERGLKLSGGERQRIAIARMVLKSPEIVLLDEATSALDTQTERHIQASLARICENRTTLIVAHRLSTVIHAHQILVLEEGTIVERGRHEELMAKGGVYSQMWLQQQRSSSADDIKALPLPHLQVDPQHIPQSSLSLSLPTLVQQTQTVSQMKTSSLSLSEMATYHLPKSESHILPESQNNVPLMAQPVEAALERSDGRLFGNPHRSRHEHHVAIPTAPDTHEAMGSSQMPDMEMTTITIQATPADAMSSQIEPAEPDVATSFLQGTTTPTVAVATATSAGATTSPATTSESPSEEQSGTFDRNQELSEQGDHCTTGSDLDPLHPEIITLGSKSCQPAVDLTTVVPMEPMAGIHDPREKVLRQQQPVRSQTTQQHTASGHHIT